MKKLLFYGLLVAAISVGSTPVVAQFTDYSPPGIEIGRIDERDPKEEIDSAIENAIWRIGGLRLEPWVGIRNVVFSSSEIQGDDVGLTAGAGLLAFLPLGSNFVLTGQATPEIVWWQKDDTRRRSHARYAVDFRGFLNRLQLRFGVARLDDLRVVAPESNQYVSQREDVADGKIEIRAFRRVHVFIEGSERKVRSLEDPIEFASFSNLDRDESFVSAGLRFRLKSTLTLEIGFQDGSVDFRSTPLDRSNEGRYPFIGLAYDNDRALFQGRLARLSLDPVGGSSFAPLDETTGEVQVEWKTGRRSRVDLQLSRRLVYSGLLDFSAVLNESLQLGFGFDVYRRTSLRVFRNVGTNHYLALRAGGVSTDVDVDSLGASLSVPMGDHLGLTATYSRIDYDSVNIPLGDGVSLLTVGFTTSVFGDPYTLR